MDNAEELAVVERMIGLIGTRMSVPVQPFPDEGLADVLFRAACENGYTRVSIIARSLGLPSGKRMTHESLARAALDPRALADLLGTRAADDALRLVYPWRDKARTRLMFFGREVRAKGFFVSHRRLAPGVLQDRCYQRAAWSILGLGFDPETREMLLDRCPECGKRLVYDTPVEIWTCSNCFSKGKFVDLRRSSHDIAQVEDKSALDFAVELIDPGVPVGSVHMRDLPRELRVFGAGEIFQLIVGLAQKLEPNGKSTGTMPTPSPANLAAASRAVLDWPHGLEALSDRLVREGSAHGQTKRERNPLRSAASAVSRELAQLVTASYYPARDRRLSTIASLENSGFPKR